MADNRNNRVLWILHTAVFLAGWTGIFGRLISLAGLPLVWYRILVSVVVLALVLAAMGRLHRVGLIVVSVLIQTWRVRHGTVFMENV